MSRVDAGADSGELAPVFAALGDPTRLNLIAMLTRGRPRSIAQLAAGSTLTRQAISKHLRVLEHAGIVASERVGREQRFVLAPAAIKEARDHLERAAAQWDQALSRLAAFVEE